MFKYFKDIVPAVEVPFLFQDLKTVSAIHNRYFVRIYSDFDEPQVATRMLREVNSPNIIQTIVEDEHLIRRNSSFETLSEDHFQNLPEWTILDIHSFCGVYQLKLAKSYIADHFDKGKYEFLVNKDSFVPKFSNYGICVSEPVFLKTKLYSRHISSKVYSQFILIDTSKPTR